MGRDRFSSSKPGHQTMVLVGTVGCNGLEGKRGFVIIADVVRWGHGHRFWACCVVLLCCVGECCVANCFCQYLKTCLPLKKGPSVLLNILEA